MPLNWSFAFGANDLPSVYIPNLNLLRTNAEAIDTEVVAARGTKPDLKGALTGVELIEEATAARTLADADAGKLVRWVLNGTKTLTINTGLTAGKAFSAYNVGPGDLTIAQGSGMLVIPPAGGTLVVPAGGLVVIWTVSGTRAEIAGVTTAA